jgi:hypothetical protein
MATSTTAAPTAAQTGTTWLRMVQGSVALIVPPLLVFAVVGTFFTTISEGDFRYTADYWYTGVGLPITLAGIGITLGVHRLQHGADGRLGRIGVWVNTVALVELFAQLLASVLQGAEVRWGPAYPVFTMVSFVGVAMVAAGCWRTGLLPKWMLGVWPVVWIVGGLGSTTWTPTLLVVFFVAFGVVLTKRVGARGPGA